MNKKRNRSTNWDEEEKQLFRYVLKEHSKVIEKKSLDTNTNKCKVKAWEQVHIKFNQLNSRPRDLNQLKIQWKSMKVQARKSYGSYQKELNKTGGGARPATPSEEVMEIKDLLNPLELMRDDNIYDSDGVVIVIPNPNTLDDTVLESGSTSLSDDDTTVVTPETKPKATVSGKKAAKRKLILNSALKSNKGKEEYVKKMVSHSAKLKNEEHLRRMQMAEEEHSIKMELHKDSLCVIKLQQDKEKREMEMAEELHAIKMQIQREILKKHIV